APARGGAAAVRMTTWGGGIWLTNPPHPTRHLEVDGAGDDHQVGLARRGAEGTRAEAIYVEARGARRHHLDGATGQAKRHRPHARLPRPIDRLFERRRDDVLLLAEPFHPSHSATPRRERVQEPVPAPTSWRGSSLTTDGTGATPSELTLRTQARSPRFHR